MQRQLLQRLSCCKANEEQPGYGVGAYGVQVCEVRGLIGYRSIGRVTIYKDSGVITIQAYDKNSIQYFFAYHFHFGARAKESETVQRKKS